MIHVEDLTKYYGDICAVDHLDLHIEKGEIVGLLGPNGAGKTTTLRMLTGFLRPSSGSIQVKELEVSGHLLEIKRLLGYLPESAPLYHDMLVFDYLTYVANIRGIQGDGKLSRIKHLADLCGINEVMHKSISELSKGYKQRVGLAHAMMNDPEILILDEPTSGLDPNQIAEIRDIIRQIGKQKTVILSTHILTEAEATCDRMIIIHQGKIVADDSTHALKRSASNECSINIILKNAEVETVEQELALVPGVKTVQRVECEEGVVAVKLTCMVQDELRENLYAAIKQTEWVIIELHQETKTLEKIFRELTKEN